MTSKYLASGAIGVELIIPAVTAESLDVYFGWVSELHGKRIKYIDFYYSEGVKSPSGRNLHNGEGAYLTLGNYQNVQFVYDTPLASLFDVNYTRGRRILFNKEIDLLKSKVTVNNVDSEDERSLYFVFWYDEPEVRNRLSAYGPLSSRNVEAVELYIPVGAKRIFWPDNRVIVDRSITNIFSFSQLVGENFTLSPNGLPFLAGYNFHSSYLTLAKGNYLFMKQVPLPLLSLDSKDYIIELENVVFDAPNSYVEISTPGQELQPCALLFNVEMQAP
jgi:hypothetical protein